MLSSAHLAWWYAQVLTKRRYDFLITRWGDLEHAHDSLDLTMLRSLGCRDDTAERTLSLLRTFDADAARHDLHCHEIDVLFIDDEKYPSMLRNIPDAPVFLSYRGDLSCLSRPCVALVGTRAMSSYGKRVSAALIPPLVHAGFTTVSGLAAGIDAQVARDTLTEGGCTAAVLGNGLASVHPDAHRTLAQNIIEHGGVLLSELPPHVQPTKFTFPARNRIIAGLSQATVVLEAAEGSGSLITADLALDYDRDVFAVPGQIFDMHYKGCHRLIAQNRARIASSPEELLTALGVFHVPQAERSTPSFDSEEERTVYAALNGMPQSLDDLSALSLTASKIAAALTHLQIKGVAQNVGEGKWVRS